MSKRLKGADLRQLIDDAEAAHKNLFSEQRSNVYLVAGHHYLQRGKDYWRKVRNNLGVNSSRNPQKVRLVQNHIQKITKSYHNNILQAAPGVRILPKNKSEFSDQKAAELHQSVWNDMKKRHNLDRMFHLLAKDYVEIGEAWCKIFFDPAKGQKVQPELELDDQGEIVGRSTDGEPLVPRRFTGDVEYERILGFNVKTDPGARSWEDCRYVIYDKMVDTQELKDQFEGDEKRIRAITETAKQTWQLFEGFGNYRPSKEGQTLVHEFYWRPNNDWPDGYYQIMVGSTILFEGELPHGIFPIVHVGFDEASTSARSFSIIKQLRPPQLEINRCLSKIAEHHTSVGDDKIVTTAGATLSAGATIHGIKHVKTNGDITYLPGRSGSQYVEHLGFNITQMYNIANLQESQIDKENANLDPYTMMFRNMREKKAFSPYISKFSDFIQIFCRTALDYAKRDYSTKMVVQVLDKKEQVNIQEFKNADDLSFIIAIEETSDDVETMMGQQIALNHVMQFASSNLKPEEIGQMIRSMPFINDEEMMSDLTIDYDNVKSDIVSMDAGRFVPAGEFDNHPYYIRKLTHRMKMKDFQFLPEPVQSNYQIKLDQHQQWQVQQQQAAAQASAGFIPSGGFLVTADIRVPKADDPTKTERAKIPVEALAWLIDTLEKQGQSQALFQSLPPSSQADIGRAMAAQGQGQLGQAG
jgi:hypothetical protein